MNLDKVLEIKDKDYNDIKKIEGKNLNPGWIEGKSRDTGGGLVDKSTGVTCTDYIEVNSNEQYTISRSTNVRDTLWVIGFNSSKQPVTDGTALSTVTSIIGRINDMTAYGTFTTTPTTKYIMWYCNKRQDGDTYQVEKGSTATTYEPYVCYWNKPTSTSTTESIIEKVLPTKAKSLRIDEYGGQSVVVNQLIKSVSTTTDHGITVTSKGNGVYNFTGTCSSNTIWKCTLVTPVIATHTYYLKGCPSGGSNNTYSLRYNSNGTGENGNGVVITGSTISNNYPAVSIASEQTVNLDFVPQLIDLTQMFGAGNEPNIDTCKKIFGNNSYIPYNTGFIQHCQPRYIVIENPD